MNKKSEAKADINILLNHIDNQINDLKRVQEQEESKMNKKTTINYGFLAFLAHFFTWMGISLYMLTKFVNMPIGTFIWIIVIETLFVIWYTHYCL
jgi:hypothetical protein